MFPRNFTSRCVNLSIYLFATEFQLFIYLFTILWYRKFGDLLLWWLSLSKFFKVYYGQNISGDLICKKIGFFKLVFSLIKNLGSIQHNCFGWLGIYIYIYNKLNYFLIFVKNLFINCVKLFYNYYLKNKDLQVLNFWKELLTSRLKFYQ